MNASFLGKKQYAAIAPSINQSVDFYRIGTNITRMGNFKMKFPILILNVLKNRLLTDFIHIVSDHSDVVRVFLCFKKPFASLSGLLSSVVDVNLFEDSAWVSFKDDYFVGNVTNLLYAMRDIDDSRIRFHLVENF